MFRKIIFAAFIAFAHAYIAQAQTLTYSDMLKIDRNDTEFEILGNVGGRYMIYKNYQQDHYVTIYNNKMEMVENVHLPFMRDKMLNVNFLNLNSRVLMLYQYQKGNIVNCFAALLDNNAQLIGEARRIDTTRIGFFASNSIYNVSFSEDKSKVLVYKSPRKDDRINFLVKTYSSEMRLLDSARQSFAFDNRRETFKEMKLANNGDIVMVKEFSTLRSDFTNELTLFRKSFGEKYFSTKTIDLLGNRIDDTELKIDNLNNRYVLAAFSVPKKGMYFTGMFTAVIPADTAIVGKVAFHQFKDSLIRIVAPRGPYKEAFDKFFIKNIVLKRDGGFIVSTEEEYSQNRYNNNWNRYPYSNYYSPYSTGYSDYYFYDPYRGRYYYNPAYDNRRSADQLNYANDIVTFSFAPNLSMDWNSVIEKETSDLGTKAHLSFSTANMNSEINYLFIASDKNKQIVNNYGLRPDGTINRYPTLKSRERGYFFMPAFAKQVNAREVIMPALRGNNLAFVKIDF